MPDTLPLGFVAGLLSLGAFLRYAVSIVRGRCRPNRATWWIWTLVGFMIWGSYREAGSQPELIWLSASFAIGPLIIGLLATHFGEGGWSRLDRVCLAASVASVGLWFLTREPLAALAINIAIDFIGALPTIRKAVAAPAGEDRTAWFLFLIASLVNFVGVSDWTPITASYPVYMAVLTLLITGLIFRLPATSAAVPASQNKNR